MINTFNLEQNLLTFPSERDVLTGGRGGVSATEDGWLDGRLLTCPSQRACSGPSSPMSQATRGECDWESESGKWDLQHSGLFRASETAGSTIPHTIEILVNSKEEMTEFIIPKDFWKTTVRAHCW